MIRRSALAAALAAALLAPAAHAHVTLQRATAPAGGFTRLDVRVPNERDDAATVKVDLQTYAGGEVVRWIGAEDSDNPAAIVTVTEAAGDDPAAHGDSATATAAATDDDDDGGGGARIRPRRACHRGIPSMTTFRALRPAARRATDRRSGAAA